MSQTFTCVPSVAWREIGGMPLGPRGRLALTRAATELPFIEKALAEVAKVRTADDPPPATADVVAAAELVQLYEADQEFPVDDGDTTVTEADQSGR